MACSGPASVLRATCSARWRRGARRLASTLGDKPTPGLRAQAVRNAIGQKRLLLVIDDAWDLAAAEPLRCGGPGCGHLLTTRDQALARAFAGARHLVQVPELAQDPAFELLRRLAPEACQADPPAARRLAQAVGGLPLALELVGGFLAAPERSLFPELSAEAWASWPTRPSGCDWPAFVSARSTAARSPCKTPSL